MNNAVFQKTIGNVRKQKEEETIWCQNKITTLQSFSQKNLLAIEMKKAEILINKPVNLGLSILELSKILMYEFWYDYVKPIYGEKVKLCYMDTVSFIVYIKTDNIRRRC